MSSFYSIHENLIMRVVERDFVFNYLRNPALPRLLIVAPSTYPRMVLNNDFINFLTYFKLWISKPSLEYSYGSPKFPNRNSREISQGVPELWSDIQTNKDYYLCLFVFIIIIFCMKTLWVIGAMREGEGEGRWCHRTSLRPVFCKKISWGLSGFPTKY